MSDNKLSTYMRQPKVMTRFAEIMGERNSMAYISSVLLAHANSEALQKCSAQSIYASALQAATLRLSVDSNLGQAYLVPFKDRATLVVGYKGLLDMAVRTGRYRYINVGAIYQGEVVTEDRITGFHSLSGSKTGDVVIGWLGAFEMVNGYAKTVYMTTQEIHDHARKYSKAYDNPGGLWKKNPRVMERKTVLRMLIRQWGYIDPADSAVLEEVETTADVVEAQVSDVPTAEQPPIQDEPPTQQRSESNIMAELGYNAASEEDHPF